MSNSSKYPMHEELQLNRSYKTMVTDYTKPAKFIDQINAEFLSLLQERDGLLEALKDVVQQAEEDTNHFHKSTACIKARAAISRVGEKV